MGVYDRDRTFNFITRNGNKDKIIDKKWLTLSGLLEETNNTSFHKFSNFLVQYSQVAAPLKLNRSKESSQWYLAQVGVLSHNAKTTQRTRQICSLATVKFVAVTVE